MSKRVIVAGAVGLVALIALTLIAVLSDAGTDPRLAMTEVVATLPGLPTVQGDGTQVEALARPTAVPGAVTRAVTLQREESIVSTEVALPTGSAGAPGSASTADRNVAAATLESDSTRDGDRLAVTAVSVSVTESGATPAAGTASNGGTASAGDVTRIVVTVASGSTPGQSTVVATAPALGQTTATPTPTASPSPTRAAGPANSISGRLLLNGQPALAGTQLTLEDAGYQVVAETNIEASGDYRFEDVPASASGYQVTFRWDLNQQYDQEDVLGWIWIGPVPLQNDQAVVLPALDVARQGFEARQPPADSIVSVGDATANRPLTFTWAAHPQASAYWVDLMRGTGLTAVWQSALTTATNIDFDGRLDNGDRWGSGSYWWAVGGRGQLGNYELVVYSHLNGLAVGP